MIYKNILRNNYLVLFVLLFILVNNLLAKEYYFYKPKNNYGSDYYFTPFNSIVNGSFDILRNGGRIQRKDLSKIEFIVGTENLFRCLTRPFNIINNHEDGVKGFICSEIIPIDGKLQNANYFPNYVTHIIGNGFLFAKTTEWFDYRGYKYPKLCSFLTTFTYQTLNEIVENGPVRKNNTDAIADMLIFNPIGYLLFSFDSTKKFFSKTIRLYDWSLQPVYNPANNFLENAGQQYIAKFDIPFVNNKNYNGFFYWGSCGMFGVSYKKDSENNFSIGVGSVAYKILAAESDNSFNDILDPKMDGLIGLFYDKNNSLMTSILIQAPKKLNVRINLYPRLFKNMFAECGIFAGFGELDGFQIGVTSVFTPIGLILGNSNED